MSKFSLLLIILVQVIYKTEEKVSKSAGKLLFDPSKDLIGVSPQQHLSLHFESLLLHLRNVLFQRVTLPHTHEVCFTEAKRWTEVISSITNIADKVEFCARVLDVVFEYLTFAKILGGECAGFLVATFY